MDAHFDEHMASDAAPDLPSPTGVPPSSFPGVPTWGTSAHAHMRVIPLTGSLRTLDEAPMPSRTSSRGSPASGSAMAGSPSGTIEIPSDASGGERDTHSPPSEDMSRPPSDDPVPSVSRPPSTDPVPSVSRPPSTDPVPSVSRPSSDDPVPSVSRPPIFRPAVQRSPIAPFVAADSRVRICQRRPDRPLLGDVYTLPAAFAGNKPMNCNIRSSAPIAGLGPVLCALDIIIAFTRLPTSEIMQKMREILRATQHRRMFAPCVMRASGGGQMEVTCVLVPHVVDLLLEFRNELTLKGLRFLSLLVRNANPDSSVRLPNWTSNAALWSYFATNPHDRHFALAFIHCAQSLNTAPVPSSNLPNFFPSAADIEEWASPNPPDRGPCAGYPTHLRPQIGLPDGDSPVCSDYKKTFSMTPWFLPVHAYSPKLEKRWLQQRHESAHMAHFQGYGVCIISRPVDLFPSHPFGLPRPGLQLMAESGSLRRSPPFWGADDIDSSGVAARRSPRLNPPSRRLRLTPTSPVSGGDMDIAPAPAPGASPSRPTVHEVSEDE